MYGARTPDSGCPMSRSCPRNRDSAEPDLVGLPSVMASPTSAVSLPSVPLHSSSMLSEGQNPRLLPPLDRAMADRAMGQARSHGSASCHVVNPTWPGRSRTGRFCANQSWVNQPRMGQFPAPQHTARVARGVPASHRIPTGQIPVVSAGPTRG